MRLKKGDKAPDFETLDILGNEIKLSDYKDKKLLLCFFRYAGCPFCNLSFFTLTQHYQDFKNKGLNIITFFQSSRTSILDQVLNRMKIKNVSIPIVADPGKRIYNLYGVESSLSLGLKSLLDIPSYVDVTIKKKFPQGKIDGDLMLMPAEFLIGPPGQTIHLAHYGVNFGDSIPLIEIVDFLLFEK